ncbi:MAG: sigma-70 family RNA polymerase sigma factor [Chloroflexi bacterium]|nr:sigma-70 family RNA polymerase sigma factor [Chloroflexota bacterium]
MDDSELEFQIIYDTYQPRILRYLLRLVGEHEAEDLTQDVFVKVSRALKTFRGESQLSTWLYRIATNAAFDRLRSPSFRKRLSENSTEIGEAEVDDKDVWTGEKTHSVEQQLVRKEMNECIRDRIERLPENYRPVLVLSELEGLSNKEIAELLGVSLDTVKIRLHRARERLKVELVRHCDSYWIEENEFVPDLKKAIEEFGATH